MGSTRLVMIVARGKPLEALMAMMCDPNVLSHDSPRAQASDRPLIIPTNIYTGQSV